MNNLRQTSMMMRRAAGLSLLTLTLCCGGAAQAKLRVISTLGTYGAIAKQIGGDNVEVTTLAKPTEDPHFVDAKPSFIVKLNSADVLIESGADLELGWLPALLQSSRNAKIQSGAPGRIIASEGIQLLGVPASVSRAQGDIHAKGNPHFMTDPAAARKVAAHIAAVFAQLDAPSAGVYQANLASFNQGIDTRFKEWAKTLAPYRGQSLAAYHDSWIYFGTRFDFTIDTFLEPKPGIAPSPAHLAAVIEKMKAAKIKAILVQPFQNRKLAESVASKTGARVVDAPQESGAAPGTETYADLMGLVVTRLAEALAAK